MENVNRDDRGKMEGTSRRKHEKDWFKAGVSKVRPVKRFYPTRGALYKKHISSL